MHNKKYFVASVQDTSELFIFEIIKLDKKVDNHIHRSIHKCRYNM